jgi:hypothetical protein
MLHVSNGVLLIIHWEPQVFEGKSPFLAVRKIGHSGLLLGIYPHDNYFALMEVDFEVRKGLKAD